tara:strand:- start:584 stop:832 length:249 start_codon:yes stop_codon:yes gene_type:complete
MTQAKEKKVKMVTLPEEYVLDLEEQLAHLLVTKVDSIIYLLECSNVDTDRTILGSEPYYTPVLNEEEQIIVKRKLLELINQF